MPVNFIQPPGPGPIVMGAPAVGYSGGMMSTPQLPFGDGATQGSISDLMLALMRAKALKDWKRRNGLSTTTPGTESQFGFNQPNTVGVDAGTAAADASSALPPDMLA